ncbi:DNA-binding transcriptional MerR regulator [Thermosporothrix hazakensis]|uniref:DNA-binding transcriptional MerR regulator n=2 Tax=Thermosporothrix TaxID=768650 RepID=A0A326U7T4_THEHA|nr:MerR family transcriptional regulator [Thermosporothrix hazakensis]PZW29518.1 DNA-binding transcriptional MerR regulator [Thermosporothrix hazakensis]BBH85804.1 putative HTH-type transcriptional regulator YyaN [Thermosporothrix sp. COM3]GCE45767.1 putative HTH-type transcriptional regulator YyaN [Thermosporothrix hazakensis]
MKIQDVVKRTGLSAYTIRFYEKSGILPRIARTPAGTRDFSEQDISFLCCMHELKQLGMSLEDITLFMRGGCPNRGREHGGLPQELLERRLQILRQYHALYEEQKRSLECMLAQIEQQLMMYEKLAEGE